MAAKSTFNLKKWYQKIAFDFHFPLSYCCHRRNIFSNTLWWMKSRFNKHLWMEKWHLVSTFDGICRLCKAVGFLWGCFTRIAGAKEFAPKAIWILSCDVPISPYLQSNIDFTFLVQSIHSQHELNSQMTKKKTSIHYLFLLWSEVAWKICNLNVLLICTCHRHYISNVSIPLFMIEFNRLMINMMLS